MTVAEFAQKVVWPRRGVVGRLAFAALAPLSLVYGTGVGIRNLGYRVGLLRTRRAPLMVISVGNLAVGGTGKTPFTLWLGRALFERGIRTAILLRGYGGRRSGVTVVSRGDGPEVDPEAVGDEAVMLAKSFPGPVVTASRRIQGAIAAAELGCEAVLLDDGFQHRALARDVDLVLVDRQPRALLPAGPLRERLGALKRADIVVLVDAGGEGAAAEAPSIAADKLVHRMSIEPAALVCSRAGRWEERHIGLLASRRVVAVSGIAQPQRFYDMLGQWDATIEEVFEFGDHHKYGPADWQEISRRSHRADLVVTTEKDLVKLEAFPFATGKLVALRVRPRVERGDELVAAVLERARARVTQAEAPAARAEPS